MTTVKKPGISFSKLNYLLAVLLLFVGACKQSSKTSTTLSSEDKTALRAIAEKDSAIVMSKKWDELVAEYSDDAVRMPPNMPAVEGRDAIRQFMNGYPPIKKFNFQLVDLQGDGNLAYMRGAWGISFMISDSTEVSDKGKILIVLKKQPDGSWLRVADAWNSDIPPEK